MTTPEHGPPEMTQEELFTTLAGWRDSAKSVSRPVALLYAGVGYLPDKFTKDDLIQTVSSDDGGRRSTDLRIFGMCHMDGIFTKDEDSKVKSGVGYPTFWRATDKAVNMA